jgi:RNA polymerase sigma-70 factor (ECF subfamily)
MQDDNLLIVQIQNKDESALSKLYDDYSAALYGVILRMCKDEQHAQNLLQDTFMTIWEKAHQYDPDKGKFYTWAYRIAKNKTLNFLRQSQKLIQTEDLSVDIIDSPLDTQEYLKLDGCINTLDHHHQRAIELVYFKGLTHREAHQEMKVPLGTFKSYINQALKKLQLKYDRVIVWLLIFITFVK